MSWQPGWYPDPTSQHQYRYWDGSVWTATVSDDGVQAHDPMVAPVAAVNPAPTRSGVGGAVYGASTDAGGLIQRLFKPAGRFNRGEYALLYLGAQAIGLVLLFVLAFVAEAARSEAPLVLYYLWFPIQATVAVLAGIRRCHDLGWPGIYLLLAFLPVANIVMMLLLLFKPGKPPGATQWG